MSLNIIKLQCPVEPSVVTIFTTNAPVKEVQRLADEITEYNNSHRDNIIDEEHMRLMSDLADADYFVSDLINEVSL